MVGFLKEPGLFLLRYFFPKYNIPFIVSIVGVYFYIENVKQVLEKVEQTIVFVGGK